MKAFKEGMNFIITEMELYAIEKYDDYDRRDKISLRERMANEQARAVIEDLVKAMKAVAVDAAIEADKVETAQQYIADDAKIDLAGEKEKADVGINRDGEVPAEAVHRSRTGLTEKVPEIHAELSETGTAEASKG